MGNIEHLRTAGLENPTPPHIIGASGQSSLPDQSVNVSSPGHKPGKRSHADTMHVARLQKREAVALQGSRSVTKTNASLPTIPCKCGSGLPKTVHTNRRGFFLGFGCKACIPTPKKSYVQKLPKHH